jgi:ubiquinone/menaquinone biosynthesis C-methylase UbiE
MGATTSPSMQIDLPSLAARPVAVPRYLEETYWWAYVRPWAVRFWDRPWLVNLILWGNYERLRDAALDALGERLDGRTLQISCVYGDITPRLRARLTPAASLDVLDVVPAQLDNVARKLRGDARVALINADSTALDMADGAYERALLFFLLHEQPAEVRRRTLAEALRIVQPGGRLVILDYHRPQPWHPLYWPMVAELKALEPFALDLWRHPLTRWFAADAPIARMTKKTYFGGLYQLLVITKAV